MESIERTDRLVDRLERVLDQGGLPHPYDRWGARLLDHLSKPVQVVVTGLAGAGKTSLIEMMSGQPVLGPRVKVPILELSYGDVDQVFIEKADGSVSSVSGVVKDCAIPDETVRVRQELSDIRLASNDFVEVSLFGGPAQETAALEAVIERADLVVWCSQEFKSDEQRLWSLVPDHVKDHSVLALTMADKLLMRGVLDENINRISPIASDEFLGLFPVATIQGITARTSAEMLNEKLWASSGGKRLTELLARQIRRGRETDLDQARVFMDRVSMRMPEIATTLAEPSALKGVPNAHDPSLRTVSKQRSAQLQQDAETVAALSKAVDLLHEYSVSMLHKVNSSEEVDPDCILKDCSEAVQSISDLLQSTGNYSSAGQVITDHIQEGEELLMLLQLERGEDAALDAVTLMLQIRKELSEKLEL